MMESSQEAFAAFLRRHLAPGLRALGFQGSGQSYSLPNGDYWILLGIQRSSFSDSTELGFTFNLTVASKEAWAVMLSHHPKWPDRPNANRFYGPGIWQSRVGSLLPDDGDKWWRITTQTDLQQLATEVLTLVRDIALPRMVELAAASTNHHLDAR